MRIVDDLERKGLAVRRPFRGTGGCGRWRSRRRRRAFDAAHVAAEPLAGRLVADLGPVSPPS